LAFGEETGNVFISEPMIKLKKIVTHLDDSIYKTIEETLIRNKADNFLFLLQSYRNSDIKDAEITAALKINSNSLYVLKSRLNDKIQEHLSGDIHSSREEVLKQLHQIPEICFGSSREVATSFLQKLEKDLLAYDMHNELLVVYSALKKIHVYSDRYFHYSQLYNKHTAFNISLEKCEEILGSFNRALAQYDFSRSPRLMETLHFLNKELSDHYALHSSRQIGLIKNMLELELAIFFSYELEVPEVLQRTEKMIEELPESSLHKHWANALNYLAFEYFRKTGQSKQAQAYLDRINPLSGTLLLYTNVCLTSRFLISRLCFFQEQNRLEELLEEDTSQLLYDPSDTHAGVLLGLYNAMIAYYRKNYKEAAAKLNEIINSNSFKDYFHINTEVRLTLAFVYLTLKEYDMADSLLKNIYRKIKSEDLSSYTNVLDLIKIFNADIKQNGKVSAKQKDDFILFLARNVNESKLLNHLEHELKKKYS
jgi:tetratricopeptide (TPR) repeat protein